jgi:hypothetical protein
MLRQAQPDQAKPQSSGNEQSGSAESRRKPSLAIVCKPGRVLSDKQFQRRLALGPRCHIEGGNRSERVLFLFGRRCGPGEGLSICLNTEDKKKGIERSLPRIEQAVDAGRLAAWVTDKAGKVERLRTERPRVDWPKVAAEVSRLAALVPADCEVETGAAARRLGQRPGMLNLFVKFVRDQQCRWDRAPRFMKWVRGAGGQWILNSDVVLRGASPLDRRLNTDDGEVEAPRRLRLLLWHAIAKGLLPGGSKHAAWLLYGGRIPEETKGLLRRLSALPWRQYELQRELMAERLGYCASTLDWLTNHEEDRRHDPERRAKCDATLRSSGRKTGKKQTPKSRSWQFSRVGMMLQVHSKGHPIYGRVTIDRLTLDWPLPVQNRTAGEAHVKPAVDARKSVKKAADDWRKCSIGSSEAKDASKALLRAQHRFRDALAVVGAKRSKNWAKVVPQFDELPFDETSRPLEDAEIEAEIERLKALRLSILDRFRSDGAEEGDTAVPQRAAAVTAAPTGKTLRQIARKGCLESLIGLLRRHDLPPQGTVPAQCEAAMREFTGLSERAFYNCLREAERVTGNDKWGKPGRRQE